MTLTAARIRAGLEVIAIETSNCLVRTDGVHVAIVGVDNLIMAAADRPHRGAEHFLSLIS
ncbi:hypothetical protein [Sphingomonas sp. BAUL-RG-20F-R05-02]|uniref:hypothetical protein n=1 Tax=Sphingomonas sp. BAUL-RG-20F-R05-02 TaxID=2914830 RepID=UPI001F56DB30|nr:hypothetical protein [Sphingomonas sp. BAUL-RG-20F-R05-02]